MAGSKQARSAAQQQCALSLGLVNHFFRRLHNKSIQHTTAREVSKPHAIACAKLLLCVCVSEC
jgi:hypothetical protein